MFKKIYPYFIVACMLLVFSKTCIASYSQLNVITTQSNASFSSHKSASFPFALNEIAINEQEDVEEDEEENNTKKSFEKQRQNAVYSSFSPINLAVLFTPKIYKIAFSLSQNQTPQALYILNNVFRI